MEVRQRKVGRRESRASAGPEKHGAAAQAVSWPPRLVAKVGPLLRRLNDPADTAAACSVASLVLLLEGVLCPAILLTVSYTKIDWDAYMEQVEGFLGGERNYLRLRGDTGPLVYPAGFLYVFSALRWLTSAQVPPAQVLFLLLYLLNLALVLSLYIKAKVVPPWALCLLCLSKRIHSIFLLRLFNDCIAMTLLHSSLLLLLYHLWTPALLLFSAAVSVKMNVLLFAPPLLLLLTKALTLWGVLSALAVAAAVQLLLGAPFLLTFPREYLSQAFDLGRVFIHHWSVNFKFVPEDVFVSKPFAHILLLTHLSLLLVLANFSWCRGEGGVLGVVGACLARTFPCLGGGGGEAPSKATQGSDRRSKGAQEETPHSPRSLSSSHMLSVMWVGNFVGICCARSLHYQFYCWYFFSLPLLLFLLPVPHYIRLLLFGVVEACWNVFPSTALSSALLLAAHLCLLCGAPALPAK